MVRVRKGHEHDHRHPEDHKKTIAELLATGGDTKIPVSFMEGVYQAPNEGVKNNKLTKKQLRKKKKRAAAKNNKWVLGSDSESDREVLNQGHGENSSGSSDVQSADEDLEQYYGVNEELVHRSKKLEAEKKFKEESKLKAQNLGESTVGFSMKKSQFDSPDKAKYKVPSKEDLNGNDTESSLYFDFGNGVGFETYIEKEDIDSDDGNPREDAVNKTQLSYGYIDKNSSVSKREDYWADKRQRKSREKAFKRKLIDKEIIRKQRAKTKKRQEELANASKKLQSMKRATDEYIQHQLETEAAIENGRTRQDVLFDIEVYQAVNRHPSFLGYKKERKMYNAAVLSPIFWGYSFENIAVPETVLPRLDVMTTHPGSVCLVDEDMNGSILCTDDSSDTNAEMANKVIDIHPASSLLYKRMVKSASKKRKKREKRQTGAQMKAAYEMKMKDIERKQILQFKAEEDRKDRFERENSLELIQNHKHIAFYGLFRAYFVERETCPAYLETPVFLNYVREAGEGDESDEEEAVVQEFDINQLGAFGSRCLICLARPGVRGYPGCPACFDHHEKLPHTFPVRKPDDIFEPIFVRPQGIVSITDAKNHHEKKPRSLKKTNTGKHLDRLNSEGSLSLTNKSNTKRYFRIGAYVEAKVKGWPEFYIGKIKSKHKDGLFYTIEFENGEIAEDIPCRRVRKLKKQRVRTTDKYTSDTVAVRHRNISKTELPEEERLKKKEKFSLDGEIAKQAKKKMAWLSKMHTRLVDRASILVHRDTEGYNPITLWIKSIPSGHVVRLVCNDTENIDEMVRLFQANSGEYGPEALGYFFLPTEAGCFFLDNSLNFATDLRNEYLPGDRKLRDYGIGAFGAGNEVSILKVSAAGGISDPNPRCVPSMVLKYFNQNFSVVLGKELRTNLIIRVMEDAPKKLPGLDWVQHSIIRVVQDQLRMKDDIARQEKEVEEAKKVALKEKLQIEHKDKMLKHKREKYRREKALLAAQLGSIDVNFEKSGDILKDGAKLAEINRLKKKIRRIEQKEYKLERGLTHRTRRDEDAVPMYVFRKFVPVVKELEEYKKIRRRRLTTFGIFKQQFIRPFLALANKFPKHVEKFKIIGKKVKDKVVALKDKLTPTFIKTLKRNYLEWKKNKSGGDEFVGEPEKEFDEKDFLNMTKAQRAKVRAAVKKRLKGNRAKIEARKRALKDMKHENEIKAKYTTYRHQYHVPYQEVKPLAYVVDPYA
jgi:hypothetical protein